MTKKKIRLDFWFWVKVLVVGIMLLFLIYPFCTLITKSFFSSKTGLLSLDNYIRFFTKKYYYSALFRSLFVSSVSTITTLIVGVPIAYLMNRYNVWMKKYIHIFIIMSLMRPALYRRLQLDHAVRPGRACDLIFQGHLRHRPFQHLRETGNHPGVYL